MIRRPPRSTRTDTLFPDTTRFRSGLMRKFGRFRAEAREHLNLRRGVRHMILAAHDMADPHRDIVDHARQQIEPAAVGAAHHRSEEHTSELHSLMRISYAVFCLKKKKLLTNNTYDHYIQQ